jgi:hypothetical protein
MGADSPAPAGPRLSITGGCGCGAVRWEVTEPFIAAGYCHCTRCQRRTGVAAGASAAVAPGAFRMTQGEQRIRAWKPEGGWEKWFCGDCGSALFSRDGEQISVRMGSIDGDPGIRPQYHQYVAYAAAWEPLPDDGLTRYAGARPAPSPLS